MAADTRPYKSKEQDGQGNEVIIRDQQLVEQSTVTTMPSGACFETFDIDGRPVKIPRDNMISIVLECMGIVLNDSSKNLGTNVNKALGLQDNTIGNVTVSDFASVLGVANGKESSVAQGQEGLEQIPSSIGFVFVRDDFYNGYCALWLFHSGDLRVIYEENNATLSATNASARAYCTGQLNGNAAYIKIKNNYTGTVKIIYKYLSIQ